MGLLKRLGRPGESVQLLAFSNHFGSVEIKPGWTRYAQYLSNPVLQEGVEMNNAIPITHKKGEKILGNLIPVDFDKGQGVRFDSDGDMPVNSYVEEKTFTIDEDGNITQNPDGPIKKKFLVEVYKGLPVYSKKNGKGDMGFARVVKFDITPELVNVKTNPKLIGHATSSEILSNAIRLKPLRFQIIIALLGGLLLGMLLGMGMG